MRSHARGRSACFSLSQIHVPREEEGGGHTDVDSFHFGMRMLESWIVEAELRVKGFAE